MKNRENFKRYLVKCLIVIIVFITIFIFINNREYNSYKKNFNYKINAILEVVQSNYPNVSKKDLLEILTSDTTEDNILSEYGYEIDKDSFIQENDNINFKYSILKIIVAVAFIILLIYLFNKYDLRCDKDIDKIIRTIEKINNKNYELDLGELSEDKLSILKEEIYKTTILLKETADNSLKDKINIKNSLQDISHQLKTPLTSISLMLDNMIDVPEMDIETRDKFIMQIKREISNITFLVGSILKLSKFEANTIDFVRDKVPVKNIIDECIKNVSNLCDIKDITIEVVNVCNNTIYCDYRWQIEAITNILKNAVEYSDKASRILIECKDNKIYTQIKIIDFGKGMDKEDVLNVFKRFYKGKNANSDSIGIGLSLSRAIIEKDNGNVTATSVKGEGTTFVIKYFKF